MSTETAGFSQPLMMGTYKGEMRGASFGGAVCHRCQPGGVVLLDYALWHGS